jgi:hypothetical protein
VSPRVLLILAALTALAVGSSSGPAPAGPPVTAHAWPSASATARGSDRPVPAPPRALFHTQHPLPAPRRAFAADDAGTLAPAVAEDRPLVYVPHNRSGDVWEIDPAT